MKTFWRVLAVLVVFPAVSRAQIGKITSPSSGATPDVVFASTACTSAVGTDAYACSPATTPCPAALANGQYVFLTTDVANTGAATFAYCGLAAKAIVYPSPTVSVALVTGDMLANSGYLLQYNSTGDNWKLGQSSATPSLVSPNVFANGSAATAALGIGVTGTGLYNRGGGSTLDVTVGGVAQAEWTASVLSLEQTKKYCWVAGGFGTSVDTCMSHPAPAVIQAEGASSAAGWFRNAAGELALAANYTNATASFTNTNLSATVISGRTYNFSMNLTFADSTAADGAQFDFNGGSAAMTDFRVQCTASNASGAALVITNAGSTALATAIQVALALTTQAGITCNGSFVPSGAGTFIVRAAQTAHSTGTLTVHRGSWISLKDANPL